MSEFVETHLVKATFNPTGVTGERTQAAHPLAVYVPMNAIITRAYYDVITAFTSTAGGTGKATIALHVKTADDLVAAIAIEDVSVVWAAGVHGTLAGSPILGSDAATETKCTAILYSAVRATSMIKTDATYEVTATVGTCALTGGKLNLYIEYIMST